MTTYSLRPQYENVKSYYNKAQVLHIDGENILLYSYTTLVCSVNKKLRIFYLYDKYDHSQTTLRHVKEFLQQHGFKKMTKKELEEAYKNE